MPHGATARFTARFLFDAGSGVCLWAADDATRNRFGYPIDHEALGLPPDLSAAVGRLIAWYDEAFDWDDPGNPRPWDEEDSRRFDAAATDVLVRIRSELGGAWTILDQLHTPRQQPTDP